MSRATPELLEREATRLLNSIEGAELTRKQRLEIPQQTIPAQDPVERRSNMSEVTLGYTEAQARLEAARCLQCKNAVCVEGCPVGVDIPSFIQAIEDGRYAEAIAIIHRTNILPAICGRVCPQENQCQATCTVGKVHKDPLKAVSIGRLERFVADYERSTQGSGVPEVKPETGKRVAVIGSGPASITVAADLRREGHAVTILEAFHRPGGVMVYGIPEFRLPKAIVEDEIHTLERMGVEIRTNFLVGRTRRLHDLFDKDGYDAVFIGSGAGLPKFLGIEGENLVGVFSANEFLTRSNLMKAYDREHAETPIFQPRKVAVFGGGNVAMDAARTAVRLEAEEVNVIYRRTRTEMPARAEEVDNAEEEGVRFHFLRSPKRILGNEDERVVGVECLAYELGEPDDSGRRRPVPIPGSETVIEVDTALVSIGNDSHPLITQTTPELETNKWGNILTDENGKTSMDRVYAGGDIVLGAATVILAMGEGRKAAASIHELLTSDSDDSA